jgi:DNA primase
MIDPQHLKAQLDLVAVLRALGLELKRTGTNYFALCPFHVETTASLSVNPRVQLWRCFGCGIGGDVFTFVQKYDHLDFRLALQKLNSMLTTTPEVRRS